MNNHNLRDCFPVGPKIFVCLKNLWHFDLVWSNWAYIQIYAQLDLQLLRCYLVQANLRGSYISIIRLISITLSDWWCGPENSKFALFEWPSHLDRSSFIVIMFWSLPYQIIVGIELPSLHFVTRIETSFIDIYIYSTSGSIQMGSCHFELEHDVSTSTLSLISIYWSKHD